MAKGQTTTIKRGQQLSPRRIRQFQRRILAWYRRHGQPDFIWRKNPTPYRVLVAEVMLQQTQVARVEPKYREFSCHYPTIVALARASPVELLRLWSGLGYNRRALLLRECARQVMLRHGGRLPTDVAALEALPAIGPYTARAVLVFAHNANAVCIDTNVRRVLIHELGLPHDVSHRELEAVARSVLPPGRARDWHNALMDYGRMKLTSRVTGVKPLGSKTEPFADSRRYYRGQIVKLLTYRSSVALPTIARKLHLSRLKCHIIVEGLVRDGLVQVAGNQVQLPQSNK